MVIARSIWCTLIYRKLYAFLADNELVSCFHFQENRGNALLDSVSVSIQEKVSKMSALRAFDLRMDCGNHVENAVNKFN
jgi:hypothetical protein